MKRFFLFCSGANTSVLRACPTEESKYVGIGVTILFTAVFASLSGGYALYTVFHSIVAAIFFGLLWGAGIFNLDRVIVSGMRKQKNRLVDLAYALPRLVFAFFLAVVISRPLELRLFDAEIAEKWERMKIEADNLDRADIAAGDSARMAVLTRENDRLQKEIDARRQEFKTAEDAWIREKDGTAGTEIPGAGPVFAEKQRVMENARIQLDSAEARNLPAINRIRGEIARIETEQEQRFDRTESARAEGLGFLARMEALGRLKEKSPTIRLASLFIMLLFISLETAPVMVKLLSTFSPYRPYDELLAQQEFEVVESVKQQMRTREHALKTDAERAMENYRGMVDSEIRLSSRRTKIREAAELRANEALMQHVADAQAEIAEVMVDEWKRRELEKIESQLEEYARST